MSLIGYCKDGEYSALVYEYMPEGTVQDKLRGNLPLTTKRKIKLTKDNLIKDLAFKYQMQDLLQKQNQWIGKID